MKYPIQLSCLSPEIDQVDKNMEDPATGKRKINFIDENIVMRQNGFCCYSIEYFFYAIETFEWFAVYEVDGNGGRLREVGDIEEGLGRLREVEGGWNTSLNFSQPHSTSLNFSCNKLLIQKRYIGSLEIVFSGYFLNGYPRFEIRECGFKGFSPFL